MSGTVTPSRAPGLPASLPYRIPSSTCWPDLPVGARYTLSFPTAPATGSEYSLTRLRLAENASAEAPTAVLPKVAGACCTTAVCAELAGREGPAELDAVTDTRSVLPTSAEPTG